MSRESELSSRRRLQTLTLALSVLLGTAALFGLSPPAGAAGHVNWPAYLDGPLHDSYQKANTAITVSNAGGLTKAWNWMPDAPPLTSLGYALVSSPVVVNRVVYIGASNGSFYALNESNGAVLWRDFIGYQATTTCPFARGFSATATVANDPTSGKQAVYVAAPNGYLYAFNASTGATLWRSVIGIPSHTQNDYYDWSSPTVANGHIYVGIASSCDNPLVRGGLLEFAQASGNKLAAYHTVPAGDVGGSIWTSAAVAGNGTVYVTTGNGPATNPSLGTSLSIIALNGATLARESSWQVPVSQQPNIDSDFSGSPTFFSATLGTSTTKTTMVGACNKNGFYYAFRAANLAAGPVWSDQMGGYGIDYEQCDAAAVSDGSHLFLSGPITTINGTSYGGSVEEVDPATGAVLWATGLPNSVQDTPALDGAGVLSLATIGGPASAGPFAGYLIDASTGRILATLDEGNSPEFAQPVFANRFVLLATLTGGLTAYLAPG
jgi:outer membrane protein assembly factor BamB